MAQRELCRSPARRCARVAPSTSQGAITMQHSVITESGDQVAAVVGSGTESDTVVVHVQLRPRRGSARRCLAALAELAGAHPGVSFTLTDRKSTRLNSSHANISYAVFC